MYMYVVTCTLGCFFPIQKIQCVSVYQIVLVVWVQVCIQMGKCVCEQSVVCVNSTSVVGIMSFARFCANSCCVWVKRLVGSLSVCCAVTALLCFYVLSASLCAPRTLFCSPDVLNCFSSDSLCVVV